VARQEPNLTQVSALIRLLGSTPLDSDVERLHTTRENLRTTLYLSVRILRALRTEAATYRRAYVPRDERMRIRADLAPIVRAAFGDNATLTGHRLRLGDLEARLKHYASTSVPVIALARMVAECLDEEYADHFWEQILRYYNLHESNKEHGPVSVPLTMSDPVPVCASIFGGTGPDRGTNPRNLPKWRSPERIGHFVLAPPGVDQFQLRLNFELTKELGALQSSGRRIAVISPTEHLTDFKWDTDENQTRYWNVRRRSSRDDPKGPSDTAYQRQLRNGVDIAVANNTRMIVLPELSLTEDHTKKLIEYWKRKQPKPKDGATKRQPSILVAGSRHGSGEPTHNTAAIVGKMESFDVLKAVPHVYRPPREPDDPHKIADSSRVVSELNEDEERFEIVESIEQYDTPEVTIFCGRHLTLGVVVCVDFLMDALRDLLRDLDVGMVVIPSMTDKTHVFHRLIDGHVAATQGVALLANGIRSRDEQARVLVGVPKPPYLLTECALENPSPRSGPGVAIIDLDNPSASDWVSIDT